MYDTVEIVGKFLHIDGYMYYAPPKLIFVLRRVAERTGGNWSTDDAAAAGTTRS